MYSYKWFEGAWPQPTYHREYHDCIRQLGLFPNVHGVTVHFDRHAGEDGDDNLFQDPDYQRLWLRRILSPLGGRVKKLALRHFENTGDKGVQSRSETPELLSTMSGVKSFRLSVKHRETSADSGPMYKVRAHKLNRSESLGTASQCLSVPLLQTHMLSVGFNAGHLSFLQHQNY